MNCNKNDRHMKYYTLNTQFSYMTDDTLTEILNNSKEGKTQGYGLNVKITVSDIKIFTKSIPVTQIEYDNQYNGKNLHSLPYVYNFGIGSAGFNVNRELLMHIKTTNWVLSDQIENFPLLYHWRIIKNKDYSKNYSLSKEDEERIQKRYKYWNSNDNIKKYLLERLNPPYILILCLEYIPYVLGEWLNDDPNKITLYMNQMMKTINFLKYNNIIHFDAHPYNILTDGKTMYLTDFGLVLDKQYLSEKEELEFFNNNNYIDYGYIISNLFEYMFDKIFADKYFPYFEEKYGIKKGTHNFESNTQIINKNLK